MPQEETGLDKDAIVMTHQIRSISKERLGAVCGKISNPNLKEQIQDTMKLYLEMS